MKTQTTLAILGTNPRGVEGPVQGDRWDRLQGLLGSLEQAPVDSYWAGHAACHALMNGVPRVVVAGVASLADQEAVIDAALRLLARSPDMLVVPGLTDMACCQTLIAACEAVDEPPMLWLDPPRGSDPVRAMAHAKALDLGGPYRRLVTPWVATQSPGRPSSELLPGSCLVGPLHLGSAELLRGLHDSPAPLHADRRVALETAGCGLLETRGARRQLGLAFPPPLAAVAGVEPGSLDGRIEALLERACAPLLVGQRNDQALWKSLVREATAALRPLQRSGELRSFVVRCDADTNEGGGQSPVLEVLVQEPQRVRSLILRVGAL